MRSLLAHLREEADMVIIDTPPLLAVSDAIPLQEQVSGTVVVARMDYTSRDGVRKAGAFISTAGGSVLGLVATGVQIGGVGGYAYAYGYGYTAENGASPNGQRRRFPLGRRLRSRSKV
jgi:Mrp family chromosome partitioning ATPase